MASLKVYTRQDKAAFLNHLGKNDIQINSTDVEDIKKDGNNKSYFNRYGYKIDTTNEADKIKTNLYKLENIDKPIKGLSSYKVSELIDICNKLSIETKNQDAGAVIKNQQDAHWKVNLKLKYLLHPALRHLRRIGWVGWYGYHHKCNFSV
jgi:hypothetical protein